MVMSFCKFSPSFATENKTYIDNTFINEFLPSAPDMCVKAYILGLSKCNGGNEAENSLEFFAKTLKISEDDVISIFKYWEDLGLVQILSTTPAEVRFLPIISNSKNIKKYKVDKYANFNIQVQEMFEHRMVMPNEFAEFYNLMERHNFEENALIALIKYCVDNKGFNLSPNYCIVVAKNWLKEGIINLEQVSKKIEELGVANENMALILSAMGSKRKPQLEDKELLNKWLNDYNFEMQVIVFVVKNLKSKKRHVDVNVLDEYLTKYYEMKLMSVQEIEHYENEKDNMFNLAKTVNQQLGIYYEDLTNEIEKYVVNWLNMGFNLETLKTIANNCHGTTVRTLESFNNIVTKLFKLGITNLNGYQKYLQDNLAVDSLINEVLQELNLQRKANANDRTFYKIWSVDWGFSHQIILYAASLSKNKANAIAYLNKILSNWNGAGLKTLEEVKAVKIDDKPTDFIHNNYTKEQIQSLMTNLDEVEV